MHSAVLANVGGDSFQLRIDRKSLGAAVPAEVFIGSDAGSACGALGHLSHNMETQEGLANDNLVAVAKSLPLSGGQSLAAIDERTICRTQIFEKILATAQRDARMAA